MASSCTWYLLSISSEFLAVRRMSWIVSGCSNSTPLVCYRGPSARRSGGSPALLHAPEGYAGILCGPAYPAHAEGACADECAGTPGSGRHHRGHRHAHHPGNHCRRAQSLRLAAMREAGCKKDAATIARALQGNWREEHLFALRQAVELFDIYQEKIHDCDRKILDTCIRWRTTLRAAQAHHPSRREVCSQE